MTLLERIEANRCVVADCARAKLPDAIVCASCLNLLWGNKLVRLADGSFIERRTFRPRDETGRIAA